MARGTAHRAHIDSSDGAGLRLGGARADFVAGLGRKVKDLRGCLAHVREQATDLAAREELRRKLHALSSGAKLMKFDAMDRSIVEALGTIDRSDLDLPMEASDLDAIDQVLEDLPALAWGDGQARTSSVEQIARRPSRYGALVVGPATIAEALLEEDERGYQLFSCESTPDAQAAFDLARIGEPDLVVIDADVDAASELVEALMDDAKTETAVIVVVGSFEKPGDEARYVAMGVAKTVAKPTSKDALRDACEAALQTRVAVTEVRFQNGHATSHAELPAREEGPARSDRARARVRGPASEVRLEGRRVVVADDDPAVVWFFANILKQEGCLVHEAFDGKRALEAAYRASPDLVMTDILMPELDGYSLCRALARDVALRDVPVLLLSWKEDLLQRVRELGAGAAGYLRKETDTRAVVARIREALRPRARIEARLEESTFDVRGRMDGMSARSLLEMVAVTRPDARVTVRDASFVYEIDIRGGSPIRASRTAGDGATLRGPQVLAALLGVGAGRFTVSASTAKVEPDLEGNLAALLAEPIARARAATALLAGAGAMKVDRVVLDDVALEAYLRATPGHAGAALMRIADGTPPRKLVVEGACEPSLVEGLVCDLAVRGVVVGIEDEGGADLLGPEIERLLRHTDERADDALQEGQEPAPPPTPAPLAVEHGAALVRAMGATPTEAANDCARDFLAPVCESPIPEGAVAKTCATDVDVAAARAAWDEAADGAEDEEQDVASSLEEAVLREVANRSPDPAPIALSFGAETREPSAPRDVQDDGTPTHEELLALAEPTVIDGTSYAERAEAERDVSEPRLSIDVTEGEDDDDAASESSELASSRDDEGATREDAASEDDDAAGATADANTTKTPPTSETIGGEDEVPAGVPTSRRRSGIVSTIAFVIATGLVAWAVMHFASNDGAGTESAPPEPETTLTAPGAGTIYEGLPTGTDVAAGQGMLTVLAPDDATVAVDGTARGQGSVTLTLWAGAHDVRFGAAGTESARQIEVRSGRLARADLRAQ